MQIWKDNRPYLAQAIERINELKAENERLQSERDEALEDCVDLHMKYIEQQKILKEVAQTPVAFPASREWGYLSKKIIEQAKATLEGGEEDGN